jgi:signal transduction histidine kinase
VRRLTAAFDHMRRALEDRHAMEQFVADLSHELKNPVSAIRAACEVLIDEGAADDEQARGLFLRRIDEASTRLEFLLQDLLALARLEARGIEEAGAPVELDEVVRAALSAHAGRLETRQLAIRPRLEAVRVRGSERWLRRAVDNLVSNAARYAPEGSAIDVDLRAAEPFAELRVRDHGPGVAPQIRPRMFERFVTDRADTGGTGLGLAIVRSVAEHHGGDVRLEDPEGGGARFVLRIRIS